MGGTHGWDTWVGHLGGTHGWDRLVGHMGGDTWAGHIIAEMTDGEGYMAHAMFNGGNVGWNESFLCTSG